MKAPFPYFGGKASVAGVVWTALGQTRHYIEPFFGSGAVLLARPNYDPQKHIETVNDTDGHIANVWRALQFNPDEVARWCDWPISHIDLSTRKIKLIEKREYLLDGLASSDEWHDARLAGSGGGYSAIGNNAQGKANRKREVLYLSPHCHNDGLFE